MKKYIFGFMSVFITASILFSSVPARADFEGQIYSLSLEDAINMALTDNERIIANEHKQIADKKSVTSAYMTKKSYRNFPVNVTNNFELYCTKEGYYADAAEMAQRLNIIDAQRIKSSISYEVTNAYYNLVLIRKLVAAAENAYRLALLNKDIVDEQYSLGLIPELDYENALISVEMAKSSLDTYKLNEDIAVENLKIQLGTDDKGVVFVLTDEIEADEYASDVQKDTDSALNTRYDVNALIENEKLAESYVKLASVLTEDSATYNSAYASLLETRYNRNASVRLIKLSIKSSYNNITTTHENMKIAEKQYNISLKQYEAAKIKYDLGVIANIELTSCINDLYNAQVSYANAKLSYRMAIEKYKYEITTGL